MRANNLNLLRLLAAAAVVVSHSYPLALGVGAPEPLSGILGIDLGKAALRCFFAISGFLMLGSLERSTPADFWIARAARLLPALAVVSLLLAFGIGPLFTTQADYLRQPLTWIYPLWTLIVPAVPASLPGLFDHLPYPGVNGLLWTLHYEVACYAGLFVAGALGVMRRTTVPVALAAYGLFYLVALGSEAATLSLPFVVGVVFYRFRVPLHWIGALLLVGVAVLDRVAGNPAPDLISIVIAYVSLWLGFVEIPALWTFNRLGDYSYGLYIYAWPLQQMIMTLRPRSSPLFLMTAALTLALQFAIASWHLIEAPALRWKSALLRRRRTLDRFCPSRSAEPSAHMHDEPIPN